MMEIECIARQHIEPSIQIGFLSLCPPWRAVAVRRRKAPVVRARVEPDVAIVVNAPRRGAHPSLDPLKECLHRTLIADQRSVQQEPYDSQPNVNGE